VAPGVHRVSVPLPFPPGEVAAWIVEGDDGFTLVDTGIDTPPARAALRSGAEHLGVTPGNLAHVLITHVHIDHYGLAGVVRAWSGAPVAMHEREEVVARSWVDDWPAQRTAAAAAFRRSGVPPEAARRMLGAADHLHGLYPDFRPDTLLVGEAGGLPGGGGWEWLLTPGHSPGHLTVHHPDRRILIAGDHVLPRISPNVGADAYAADPLTAYLASLERLRSLAVDLVLPSHGEPFGDLAGRIAELAAHHAARNLRILEHADRPRTTFEITLALFPGLRPDELLHAFRETRAHLVYLARTGAVVPGESGGVERWRRT
jgi:glyoxylase-like metal-dependent hydrolase (beta-lactamase superfamily II)